MNTLPVKERLPILAALRKAVCDAYDAARDELADELDVGDRKTLFVNGAKVGSASYAEGRTMVTTYDPMALLEWATDNGYPVEVKLPSNLYGKGGSMTIEGEYLITRDGEAVPGVTVEKGKGSVKVTGCKPEEIMPMLTAEQFTAALSIDEGRLLNG